MKVVVIGTNGLLSNAIGYYCNSNSYKLSMIGLNAPISHDFNFFHKVNLLAEEIDYSILCESDIIIYAAGAGIQSNLNESAEIIYGLNVTVPVKICNRLKTVDYKGVFVSFGSYFEIGSTNTDTYFNENDIVGSQLEVPNDYCISKRMLTRFFSSLKSNYKSWHFILPTIYGEEEASHRLIPYTLKSINEGRELKFTSGEQIRQYVYIDDVVEIVFKCLVFKLNSGIYNIAGSEEFSVREIVEVLFNYMNIQVPTDAFGMEIRTDVQMKNLRLNGNLLNSLINYKPSTKITEVCFKYFQNGEHRNN